MILKEFDLYVPNDRQLNMRVRGSSRCMDALFESCFQRGFKTEGIWKVEAYMNEALRQTLRVGVCEMRR